MRAFWRVLPYVLIGFGVLVPLVSVLAEYLGPDRTRINYVWERRYCQYQAVYHPTATATPSGPTWYGCQLHWYEPPDSSCPAASGMKGYFTMGACSWTTNCGEGCSVSLEVSRIEGCREGEMGCRLREQVVTYPEATVTGVLECPQWGEGGWCTGRANVALSGAEPVSGYSILAIEGRRNGEVFACWGVSSCSVPLEEGENAFEFWALSSWGDSSRMGSLSGRQDTREPVVEGVLEGGEGTGRLVSVAC